MCIPGCLLVVTSIIWLSAPEGRITLTCMRPGDRAALLLCYTKCCAQLLQSGQCWTNAWPLIKQFVSLQARDSDESTQTKKARVVWTPEMHQQFVEAVQALGIDSAHLS